MTALPGPNVIHQVLIAATLYGRVVRCGCGWRAVHGAEAAARKSGQRHLWTTHGAQMPSQAPEGDAAA